MNLKLSQGFELSNEHPASSYGIPVLLKKGTAYGPGKKRQGLRTRRYCLAYGPGDIVWSDREGGPGMLARELVTRLVNNMPRSRRDRWTHAEIDLVMKFSEQLNVLFRLTP